MTEPNNAAPIFHTNGDSNFYTGDVEIFVNGELMGNLAAEGATLGSFINKVAHIHSLRNFSVYLDGVALDPHNTTATGSVVSAKQINLVAKDARGLADVFDSGIGAAAIIGAAATMGVPLEDAAGEEEEEEEEEEEGNLDD